MRNYRVAIVGATGLVGQEFIKILLQRNFPMASIRLLASDRSAGKKIPGGDEAFKQNIARLKSYRVDNRQ